MYEYLHIIVYENKFGTVAIAGNRKMNGAAVAESRSESKKEHEIVFDLIL